MTTENIKNIDLSHHIEPGDKVGVSEASLDYALDQLKKLEGKDLDGFVFCAKVKSVDGKPERGLEVLCCTLTDSKIMIANLICKIQSTVQKHSLDDDS